MDDGGASRGPDRRSLLVGAAASGLLPWSSLLAAGSAAAGERSVAAGGLRWPARSLLKPDERASLRFRAKGKAARRIMVVDDFETDRGWRATPAVKLSYSGKQVKQGTRSLRFATLVRDEAYIRASRSPNGSFTGQGVLFDGMPFAASAHLKLEKPQDWSAFDRISLWCHVAADASPILSLSLGFVCDGADAGPTDPVAVNYFGDFERGAWNLLTWEIPEYRRDRVSELVIMASIFGVGVAGASPEAIFHFDQLQVEQVQAEPVSGWDVPSNVIAYSHLGYPAHGTKIAIAPPDAGETFELLDESGAVARRLSVRQVQTRRGRFSLLDFSEVVAPGGYRLRVGERQTALFQIGEAPQHHLIEATLNAFLGFRCGYALPGVHDACHTDVTVEYKGERRVVGGGWHDAGNLTQGPGRTHPSIYALARLHDQLKAEGADPDLVARVLEEARWGAEWSLRMRFGPGLRCLYGQYSYYTDGKTGDDDDVVQDNVGIDVFQNILATLAAACAAPAFRDGDPAFAAALLKAAEEDFVTVVAARPAPPAGAPPINLNEGSWRDEVGYLTLAAVELHRATGKSAYRAEAARLAKWLLALQQQAFEGLSPVTGYFYEDAGRTRRVHEFHHSFEECGLLALQALCDAFDDHPDWTQWYAGLTIYSEFFCRRGAEASAPFDVLPAAVWSRSDLDLPAPPDREGAMLARVSNPVFPTAPTPQLVRSQMQRQFDDGVPLSPDLRLRVFPLWYDHVRHGASVVQLSKTAGLAAAAVARNRPDLGDLAARQLQWVVGLNPLGRSLIYGVGHDFWQNFTTCMPNFVGGMSLGFNSYADDAPAWGNNAVFPYKEQWVFASCRLALNLASIGRPARIRGHAPRGAELRHRLTGEVPSIAPGPFERWIAPGEYTVSHGGFEETRRFADAGRYDLVFDATRVLDIVGEAHGDRLQLRLRGRGRHPLRWRAFNAAVDAAPQVVDLQDERALSLQFAVQDAAKPWVVVVEPTGDPARRLELFGGGPQSAPLSAATAGGTQTGTNA